MSSADSAIRSFSTYVHGQDADLLMESHDSAVRLKAWTLEDPARAAIMAGVLREWAASPMGDEELFDWLFDVEAVDGDVDEETIRASLLAEAAMIDAELAR